MKKGEPFTVHCNDPRGVIVKIKEMLNKQTEELENKVETPVTNNEEVFGLLFKDMLKEDSLLLDFAEQTNKGVGMLNQLDELIEELPDNLDPILRNNIERVRSVYAEFLEQSVGHIQFSGTQRSGSH